MSKAAKNLQEDAPKQPRIRPCHDFILVKRHSMESKSPGGIIIPDQAQRKGQYGEVLAVGPGKWNEAGTARIPVSVKVGDVVVLPKYAGAEDMRGAMPSEWVLIHDTQIDGVVEP